MPGIDLFLDSSALFAGIASATSAARALLLLAETGHITITISEQVVAETERAIARKLPGALEDLRQAILASKARILHDPSTEDVKAHPDLISHAADVPIVLAAMHTRADYLVKLNRVHFLDDPDVGEKAGLKIGTPGEALGWVRGRIAEEE
jgi:predicted nucleic acid-binding protein